MIKVKLQIDQVAIYVGDRNKAVEDFSKTFSLNEWVEDEVESDVFNYNLAFNYSLLEGGIEFELIENVEGTSYHNELEPPCISHFGIHVDDLEKAIEYFKINGFEEMQTVTTQNHSGTDNRYKYTFIDTRGLLGCPLKLIKRIDV